MSLSVVLEVVTINFGVAPVSGLFGIDTRGVVDVVLLGVCAALWTFVSAIMLPSAVEIDIVGVVVELVHFSTLTAPRAQAADVMPETEGPSKRLVSGSLKDDNKKKQKKM